MERSGIRTPGTPDASRQDGVALGILNFRVAMTLDSPGGLFSS